MAPHWWVPVKASDPKARRTEVENVLPQYSAKLSSFWQTLDGNQLFALIETDNVSHKMLVDIGANGKAMPLEDVQ
jgi:hypothetical protein